MRLFIPEHSTSNYLDIIHILSNFSYIYAKINTLVLLLLEQYYNVTFEKYNVFNSDRKTK